MREIKFRAWDGESMTLSTDGSLERFFSHYEDLGYDNYTSVIMQFTGLQDKNQNPIFEGDILEVELDKNNLVRIEVVYQTDYASFSGLCHKTGVHYDIAFSKSPLTRKKVIGNIHENQDLLPHIGEE